MHYYIALSRDEIFHFTNYRQALKFKTQLETFYTQHIILLNEFMCKIYELYRHYYLSLNSAQISAINDLFDNLNFNLDYITSDLITTNSNHFKYNRFESIYDSMYTICSYMHKKAVRLKDTNQKFRIKAIQSHLFYIKDQSISFNEKYLKLCLNDKPVKVLKMERKVS